VHTKRRTLLSKNPSPIFHLAELIVWMAIITIHGGSSRLAYTLAIAISGGAALFFALEVRVAAGWRWVGKC
jgi:hypothetical protein